MRGFDNGRHARKARNSGLSALRSTGEVTQRNELFGIFLPHTDPKGPVDFGRLTSLGFGVSVDTPGGHEARDGKRQN